MIDLVVALASEAQPIVEAFALERSDEIDGLRVHRAGEIRLTISGMGRRSAATTVERLRIADLATPPAADRGDPMQRRKTWINFGIGGHPSFDVGTAVLAEEVLEKSSGRRWKMVPPVSSAHRTSVICTVERVEREYAEPWIYEMEASGFVSELRAPGPLEDDSIQVLKVVSDNLRRPVERLDRSTVQALCRGAIPTLGALIEDLSAVRPGPLPAPGRPA